MPLSSTAPEDSGSISGAPDLPSDLRDGYAEIGDLRLHYVEVANHWHFFRHSSQTYFAQASPKREDLMLHRVRLLIALVS